MPLRLKLTLLFSLIAAVVSAAASLLLLVQIRDGLYRSGFDTLQAHLAVTDASISSAPNLQVNADTGGQGVTQVQVAGLPITVSAPRAPLSVVQLVSSRGQVVATSGESRPLLPLSSLTGLGSSAYQGYLHLGGEREPFMVVALKSSAIPGDYLIAAMSQAAISREVHSTALALALADLGVVALTALGSFALASGALRPIGRMRAEVEAMVEKRNYGQVSVTSARDEVGRLGDTFNELLRALRDSQRSQQEFIAAAGHELRTPLAILRAELELATKEKRSEAEIRAAVAAAIAETDRLGRLSASLLNIARGEVEASARNPGPVAIGPALAGLLERMRAAFPEVTISDEISPEAVARCDEDELVQIAANLLDNAVRYSPPSSTVFIRGGRAWGWVTLEVDDEGGGIVGISTQQAIEPFVRGAAPVDGARRGSGLGLAIVTRLCQANGGDLSIGASDRGGTLVRVTLPDARLNLEESRHSRL